MFMTSVLCSVFGAQEYLYGYSEKLPHLFALRHAGDTEDVFSS